MLTDEVRARIGREYSASDAPVACDLVARFGAELSRWKEISRGDRVERAALTLADGDLVRLRSAVELGLRDWRDLLVAAGDA